MITTRSYIRYLSDEEEIEILKKSVFDLQKQLQEAYKRIRELGEENERTRRPD
jgi:predicted RNase H-like nuclease (RuvC/YqgF family)